MTALEIFGIIMGAIILAALFYPLEMDNERNERISSTLDRYNRKYGR